MGTARHPQRIIITGASAGIGAALARLYGAQGAALGLIARRESELRKIAAEISTPCEVYPLDVRDGAAVARAGQHFLAKHGDPDIVIANAGVSVGTLTDFAEDTQVFRDVVDTNVIGMVNTFQPFVGRMKESGSGALVGIASVAGYRGLPGSAAYSASKAAAITYLESLRVELRASRVDVITICPGFVATAMTVKNPYRMPFLMTPEAAAAKIARLIASGTPYAVIPWQMAIAARVLRLLPNALYDRLFARAKRKPRKAS